MMHEVQNLDGQSRLTRARWLTGLSMAVERLWPLLLPALIVLCTFAGLSWFGLFRSIPDTPRYLFVGLLSIAFLISLLPLRQFKLPTRDQINARLEATNGFAHQPISVQADRLANAPDDFSKALWETHQKRMAEKLSQVRADSPKPRTHELDRFGLRALPALSLFIAFAFSQGSLGGKLTDVWHGMAAVPPIPPRIDAWITPPRYTAKAPIFLNDVKDEAANLSVPEGSTLTVRVGAESKQTYQLSSNGNPVTTPAPDPKEQPAEATPGQLLTTKLTENAVITLGLESGPVAKWQFTIIKDKPPTITFAADPTAARNGTMALSYTVKDDYGAVKGAAEFKPLSPEEDARPLYTLPELALSLPRKSTKDNATKTTKDLTQHPLAGEEFEIKLRADDGAGQTAFSDVKAYVLPEFYLASPLARALAEDRRLLARNANAKPLVLDLLDALTIRPDETINNASHYLGIETARIRLYQAKTDDELRAVVDYLWQIALTIDENSLSDAERRLKQAQDKLAEALEKGASDEDIKQLMSELRQAMNEFMKQLAEQERKNPTSPQSDQETKELSSADLEKMLDKLEDLAKKGSKDEAKELLDQLRDMMNNLQAKRDDKGGKGGEGQSQMEGKLNELGKMLREQQKLLDETFQKDRDQQSGQGEGEPNQDGAGTEGEEGQGSQGQNGQGGQQGGQEQGPKGGLGGLQQRQNKLGEQLQGLMDGLKGLGLEPGKELGDAGRAMGRAGENLGQGEPGEAVGDQTESLNALRKGAEGLMNQMRQAMGDQGGGQQRGNKGQNDNDPLGRPRAQDGPETGKTTKVPDEIEAERAREILEAIRKRLGNALSPELEKQYLERLLKLE